MYTDGLYEVESPAGDELGEERLLAAVGGAAGTPLQDLFSTLMDTANDFAGEAGFNDDVCLVGFTYHKTM